MSARAAIRPLTLPRIVTAKSDQQIPLGDIKPVEQKASLLCWAACIVSVGLTLRTQRQWEQVQLAKHFGSCDPDTRCDDLERSDCNETADEGDIPARWHDTGFTKPKYHAIHSVDEWSEEHLTDSTPVGKLVVDALDARQAVQISDDGATHVVMAYRYSLSPSGALRLIVMDPQDNRKLHLTEPVANPRWRGVWAPIEERRP